MQPAHLEDGFLCAARLLEVGLDEVEPLIHVERLELALARPAMRVGNAPFYKTPGAVAACIWRTCALGKILPRQNVRFGFAMSMLSLEQAGYEWRWKPGDHVTFRRFGDALAAGDDPGSALVSWMTERIHTPSKRTKGKKTSVQHALHLSGPGSGLSDEEWPTIQSWAVAVDDAVVTFLQESDDPFDIYTQRPRSAPELNYDEDLSSDLEERFLAADAMIILGYKPSEGVGIKAEKAVRRLLPILYLHPKGRQLGRRMRRELADAQATVKAFEYDPDRPDVAQAWIRRLTLDWLRTEAPNITAAARLRRNHESRVARIHAALRTAATQIERRQLKANLLALRLSERRARAMLRSKWEYLSSSVHEQLALSAALGVPANIDSIVPEPVSDRPPRLTSAEYDALRHLARVDRIPPIEVLQMVALAEEELAVLGRKRVSFTTDIAWRELRQRLGS